MTRLNVSKRVVSAFTILAVSSPTLVSSGSIGPPTRTVGDGLFRANPDLEASGLVWIESSHLLAGVSDTGAVFALDPDNDDRWYVARSISGIPEGYTDLEGAAVDTGLVVGNEGGAGGHIYILNENPPALIKILYTLPAAGHDMAAAFESKADLAPGILPDFDESKGLEALTLYLPSDPVGGGGRSAVFLVGLQDNGRVYGVDATGAAVAGLDFDGGLGGLDGISGLHYDPSTGVLFSVYDKRDRVAAVDVKSGFTLATWSTEETQEEGLAFRTGDVGDLVYIASDEGGGDDDPSFITEHAFNGPTTSTTPSSTAVAPTTLEPEEEPANSLDVENRDGSGSSSLSVTTTLTVFMCALVAFAIQQGGNSESN